MPTYEHPPSAKLIARRTDKIVYNKAAVDALHAGMVDGLVDLGTRIIEDARATAPYDPKKAEARGVPPMRDTGVVTVFGFGKLVYGSGERMASRNKPKGAKTPADQVVLFVSFSSPISHLQELGTIKMNAHPFLLPAFNRAVPGLASVVVPAMGKRAASAAASVWSGQRRPWVAKATTP